GGGDAKGGQGRALAGAALQEPELALLHRELEVEHVAVVLLEVLREIDQRFADLAPGGLRGDVGGTHGIERQGGADARHHVLALGVLQELAVEAAIAGQGIAGEQHARAAVGTPV
ncbi:hypothetical protein RZS08_01160, partial [Arthrospira platensis SPKY1]|nr:hypothetical protein [Arthrospira platensis SPKY1]